MGIDHEDPGLSGAHKFFPDVHGQAALLLVESLIHGLCENGTISAGEAVAIADRAVDVQSERAEAADGAGEPLWHAYCLLTNIAESLRADDRGDPQAPRLVT